MNIWQDRNGSALVPVMLIAAIVAVLVGAQAQPAQAGFLLRKTPTPTRTPVATATRTPAPTPTMTGSPTPTAMPGPNGIWSVVASPNTGSPNNYLFGVTAIATNDVWAVGTYGTLGTADSQVIEHWDGTHWGLSASPTLTEPNELLAVSAIATNDVWAVGGDDTGGPALIEHWDGSNWTVASSPNPGTFNRFFGVAAVSSSSVWAVGEFANGGLSQTLIEHWNGSGWSVVPSPNVANVYNQLNGVAAVPGSPNDLWAVGTAGSATLIEHWNGTAWSIVSSPNPGTNPQLYSVAAVSNNDIWAVGYTGGSNGPLTLTEHWNGTAWSMITSPDPSPTQNRLLGVAALASNNVWAVGSFINPAVGNLQTLLLQWNGSSWAVVAGENTRPSGLGFELAAVSAIGASDIWSVGNDSHTLAEHWNGANWSMVTSPNAGVGQNVINAISGAASADAWEAGDFAFGTEKRTLLEHWDGARWSLIPSANSDKRTNVLNGVVAIAPSNAWAVGAADSGIVADQVTLILHWDGTTWSVVPSPSPGTAGLNALWGVAANSATDIWAVGNATNSGSNAQVLIEHWNGSTWTVIPGANVAGTNNGLYGVAALGPSNVWAVGFSGSGTFAPLVEHWDGLSWSIVPSSGGQNTSGILRAISAAGASDIWADGYATNPFTNMDTTLTEHWDGSSWGVVFGVNPFPGPNDLYGAVAVTAGDAWEVGTSGGLALIGRWNGSSWNVFPSPSTAGSLNAARAISECDVWAVGQAYVTNIGTQTLDEHFVCT